MWNKIAEHISQVTGEAFTISNQRSVSGGCINQGYAIKDDNRTYFVKLNQASQVEMFAAEALGLKQMYATKTIRIPQPICWGSAGSSAYIVMEWLDLGRGGGNEAWQAMGKQLAQMHRIGKADKFGWERHNTIGSTPQINTWGEDWAEFFAEQRIGYQLQLANKRGGNFPNPERVVAAVRESLASLEPQPSLVHGDLWSGNAAVTNSGEPVILDPATYYGDREVDIAMTELFGGFPRAFYQGYNQEWGLDSGYQERKTLYNLYHVLNHFNLFGGSYGSQASRIIKEILV
ncbi:MAG: fructosamine kinase family protein [Spirulinaceae cyanobacterium]